MEELITKHFSKIEFLGLNQDNRGHDRCSRPFFRCVK